jgi:acyl-CoA-binding protein
MAWKGRERIRLEKRGDDLERLALTKAKINPKTYNDISKYFKSYSKNVISAKGKNSEYSKLLRDMQQNYKKAKDNGNVVGEKWWENKIKQHKKDKPFWIEAKGKSKQDMQKAYKNIFEKLKAKHGGEKKFNTEYSKETDKLGKDYSKSLQKQKLYKKLSEGYKKYWVLGARGESDGINIDELIERNKIKIRAVPSKVYDKLPEEKLRARVGEMSYAQTKITPTEIDITIRKTPNKKLMNKLLRHEKEELMIFNRLKKRGVKNAEDKAHDLTKTKVNNREVDRAYGDIGDPI